MVCGTVTPTPIYDSANSYAKLPLELNATNLTIQRIQAYIARNYAVPSSFKATLSQALKKHVEFAFSAPTRILPKIHVKACGKWWLGAKEQGYIFSPTTNT